ncbi:MAG: endonuclease [Phycisphaerales bacterium]|nr:MAG: endonuclease [Phycisphaerales bacterium]
MNVQRFLDQIQGATDRHKATAEEQKRNLNKVEAGKWREVEDPARIAHRMASRGMKEAIGKFVRAIQTDQPIDFNPLERIIGEKDLIPATYLYQGAAVARSVGRVVIRGVSGRILGYGTGFMVSPCLLITNNHVLTDRSAARHSTIQFDFWEDPMGLQGQIEEYHLQPDRFFQTDRTLDFTLVAVEAANRQGTQVARRGWSPLIAESGKSLIGELVTIVQHPGGEFQQVAVPKDKITAVNDNFLHYTADTERGSSGSGVFNKDWELAALHHAGVPAKDDQGRIQLVDDTPWNGSAATIGQIKWCANEGVRISRIVAWLRNREGGFAPAQRVLLGQAFDPRPAFDQILAATSGGRLGSPREDVAGGPMTARFDEEGGVASWTIPVNLSVRVGTGAIPGGAPAQPVPVQPAAAAQPPAALPGDMVQHPDYREAVEALAEYADRPYLDEAEDDRDCYNYYINLPWSLEGSNLYRQLHGLLTETHNETYSYRTAKLRYLYPWVDLVETAGEARELRSIYSGKGFDPLELLGLEYEIEIHREALLRERFGAEAFVNDDMMLEALEELEAQAPYNCEHVVCQSWFGRREPMRGDLHHLFTCESGCNSFRSNIPYWQFAPEEERVRTDCGERVGDKFEPHAGKGAVARATLYFLLRYPGRVGERSVELTVDRLQTLLDWHADFPPDRYERHRNAAIFEIQGNRNPLIDYPDWAATADFREGFADFLA